ncbi:hypothetical protein PFICI_07866 [Pestalotiopsis fici W106-1]|uniref:Uncharacterized protein n=1 Tax=Pestalotiopsis fici (strain W106-1 / CGMCC3.15140) TaxID=1229662 RepID=W3X4M7_PESFW|nr:uncharacterized protein PFICI_07866 [Pestalotiopsis fici W106-1]ETS80337.1 hypothetical protein PFICI_07866 [Pestalotiopsis fici W106-1]
MVSYRLVATAGLVASVYALPLNINLGAYSPALVVGDGEISFGGGQDVSQLFNTLEGAAVNAATGQSNTAGAAQAAAPAVAAEAVATPAAAPAAVVTTEETPVVAANPATDSTLSEQAASISTLQGMGKEIAPREGESPKTKRDLQGFDRALQYAENALTKGPVVQLGTGEGGAGVGIIVDNRPTTATAAAGAAAAAKRDETSASQPRRRTTKVTTMYVRRGVPQNLQGSELETRDVKTASLPSVVSAALAKKSEDSEEKRDSTSIDAINLNVDDPQGITMTFVETSEDEE